MLSFEGESLEAIIGEMRAFLAMLERPRVGGTATAAAGGAYTGPALPPCPVHLVEMRYVKAGNSRGRSFSASYRCPRAACREAVWLT